MSYANLKKKTFSLLHDDTQSFLLRKIVDMFIITLILVNVLFVILETFDGFSAEVMLLFKRLEIISVIIFTIEYLLRVWCADLFFPELGKFKSRAKYTFSFMAVVDFLAILPFYLPFIVSVDLRVLRAIRLIRIARMFKINRYTNALSIVGSVLRSKASELISSFSVVFILMLVSSILMYEVENMAQPDVFENVLSGLWWSVATFTTVGYGDIFPVTAMGKILSSIIAILGIGLVAVPTGIISAGFMEYREGEKQALCNNEDEKPFCPYCGKKIL